VDDLCGLGDLLMLKYHDILLKETEVHFYLSTPCRNRGAIPVFEKRVLSTIDALPNIIHSLFFMPTLLLLNFWAEGKSLFCISYTVLTSCKLFLCFAEYIVPREFCV
jgi:hypothetical protein